MMMIMMMIMTMIMMMMMFRSDEQRSEKHKLKKERELERDIAQQDREDDGGFSMKVGIYTLTLHSDHQHSTVIANILNIQMFSAVNKCFYFKFTVDI